MARVRGGGGASSSGRGGGGGGPAARAEADEPKLPRGMRETAALLRANGYGVLNEEKLRHPHRAEGDAARPSRPQQPQQEQQQQQQQRTVRLVEPEAAAERRRAADKRKQRDASSSEDERPARSGGAARSTQLQPAPSQGLKRVRSSWKIRPLLVGASVHIAGMSAGGCAVLRLWVASGCWAACACLPAVSSSAAPATLPDQCRCCAACCRREAAGVPGGL